MTEPVRDRAARLEAEHRANPYDADGNAVTLVDRLAAAGLLRDEPEWEYGPRYTTVNGLRSAVVPHPTRDTALEVIEESRAASPGTWTLMRRPRGTDDTAWEEVPPGE